MGKKEMCVSFLNLREYKELSIIHILFHFTFPVPILLSGYLSKL